MNFPQLFKKKKNNPHTKTKTNNPQLSEKGLDGVSYHHLSYEACS